MTPDELQQQLIEFGVVCRVQRGEVVIQTCRFCGNERWNLELNAERGIYHCWACDEGGRLDRLLREWTGYSAYIPVRLDRKVKRGVPVPSLKEFEHKQVADVPHAANFLRRRGYSADDIKRYEIVVCTQSGHQLESRLIIPLHDFWTGEVTGYIGRSTVAGQRPKYVSTASTRTITGYRTLLRERACVVVEGIFDAMAVHRAGYHAAMLSGVNNKDVQFFGHRIPAKTPIAVMLDGEAASEAEKLYWQLHRQRVPIGGTLVNVKLPPSTDPADFEPRVLDILIAHNIENNP